MDRQGESQGAERRARTTLLTTGALYVTALSIGLKVDGVGPMYLLMLGLAGVTVSKVVHLRESVDESNEYPARLVVVDLMLVAVLAVMFHLLARPFSLSSRLWGEGMLTAMSTQESLEGAFVQGAIVFWSLAFAVFAFLIPLWTWVSWKYQGLRRHSLWRYRVGWAIGGALSLVMLGTALFGTTAQLTQRYAIAGPVSLVSGLFLFLEVFAGSKFERQTPRTPPE